MSPVNPPREPNGARARVAAEPWSPGWPAEPALPRALRRGATDGTAGPLQGAWQGLVGAETSGVLRLAFPVGVAVLSRLYSLFLLSLAPLLQPDSGVPRISGYRDVLLQWDAQWYVQIANLGYHAAPMQAWGTDGHHDFAFFPGWPTVLREFETFGIQPAAVAGLLANLLFIAAAVLMFLVLERALGLTAARWGLALLAFSPASFIFSLGYSEPLFLLLVAASFLLAHTKVGPVAAAAAMLTRVTGVGLAVAAAARWWRNKRDWLAFATAGAVTLAFAAWWGFIWLLTGDPLGWFQGSAQWSNDMGLPAIWNVVSHVSDPGFLTVVYVAFMLGVSILLLRRDLELGIYSVMAIAMSMVGAPVSSMPRHALVAFPAFGLLAARLGPRRSLALAIVFALFEANSVWLSFINGWPIAP